MAEWSKNNLACRSTWLALRILEQSKKTFSKSGDIAMKKLAFWSAADTSAIRTVKARTIAIQLNNIFTLTADAEFESGHDKISAIDDMTTVLTDATKTIADLAGVADENYLFFGESA